MSEYDVLMVDDDETTLNAFKRNLGDSFKLLTFSDVTEAIKQIQENNISVVISDMKMPKIGGTDFLSIVEKHSPDSIRILLSGESGKKELIEAINTSHVHMYLDKPCPPAKLESVIRSSIQDYKKKITSKNEIDQTVKGAVQVIVCQHKFFLPEIYKKSLKIARQAKIIAEFFGLKKSWDLEMSSLLMFYGALHNKIHHWDVLMIPGNKEKSIAVSIGFLKEIPKFLKVTQILNELLKIYKSKSLILKIDSDAKLIKFLIDYNNLIADSNFETKFTDLYSSSIFKEIDNINKMLDPTFIREISPEEVAAGMIFAEPVKTKSGAIVVNEGEIVTQKHVTQVNQFYAKKQLDETLKLIDRGS